MLIQPTTARRPLLLAIAVAALVFVTLAAQQDPGAVSPPVLDVVAVDRNGAAVDNLGASDFVVTIDGNRRTVMSVRYVTRGPGALADARSLQATRAPVGQFAAEPSRTVIIVIDQTTLVRGDEKSTTAAVRGVVDRLGLDDRVGVIRLPLGTDNALVLNNDRPALIASLRGVMGQAPVTGPPAPADALGISDASRTAVLNPERAGSTELAAEQDRAATVERPAFDRALGEGRPASTNLADLHALFGSMQTMPGRKTVMLFSGGLVASDRSLVERASLAAARAHTTVQALGLKSNRLVDFPPDAGALASLARATGGQFVALGRKPDEAISRMLAGSSSCYVLTLDGELDAVARRAVKITTSRRDVALQTPAWLVSRADAADVLPEDLAAAPTTPAAPTERPVDPRDLPHAGVVDPPPAPPKPLKPATAAQEAQLRRLLARVTDYVDTYQREYASVVAEEDYEQADWRPEAQTKVLRLTSDLVLVRLDRVEGWVAYRDVFEVNRKPVREREERMQRLLLEPSVQSRARLMAIQEESARYNLGPVRRTVNTPLLPLMFLERDYLPRFQMWLGGMKNVDGLQVAEIEYLETASPTIAGTDQGTDQPAFGRFLVEPLSGAVVESRTVYARANAGQIEYVVTYRRDDKLGLWLPVEMKETYSLRNKVLTAGAARYRNFRRFQVTTDTHVTVPK
jgi:VWFA-related protein